MKIRSRPLKTRLQLIGQYAGHYAVLCAIAVVCVFPFWWTLVTAISTQGNIFAFPPTFWPKAPSFDNFIAVFQAIPIWSFFKNSVLIAVFTVFWKLLLCSLAAYPLARLKFRGRKLVFGLILATLVFLPISALPEEQLLSWGWRIPFFLSAIVVVVGFWVRRTLPETPAFQEESRQQEDDRLPLTVLLQQHKANLVRVIFAALVSVISTIFSVFTLSYAVNTVHLPRSTMLTVLVLANLVALGAIPLFAALSDRIGRRPVFIFGALGSAALAWPYMWAISTSNIPLIFVFGLLLSGVVYSAANGVWPAMYGEMFSTRVRLSGMAIGTQIGFALGGFAPTISAAILRPNDPMGWVPVAAFVTCTSIISAFAVFTARETCRVPMQDLGKK